MANKMLLEYLQRANRPYAFADLAEKCGKNLSKAAIQKALDALESQQQVRVKCVGKQKVYYAPQTGSVDKMEMRRAYEACQQKIAQVQLSIKAKQSECSALEQQLKALAQLHSVPHLEAERSQLLDEIRELNERLRNNEAAAQAGGQAAQFTPAVVERINKRHEHVSQAYRKRRRMCLDLLDAIMEGYPDTRRALYDDIGIETDEMAEFRI